MTAQSLLTTLLPLVADLSRELPEGERYRRLLQATRTLLPCDTAALLRLDGEWLVPLAADGLSADTLDRRFKVSEHPRFEVLLSSPGPYDGLVDDLHGHLEVNDCMGWPLFIDDQPWGLITFDALDTERFERVETETLQAFASLAAATVKATERIEHQGSRTQNHRAEIYRQSSTQRFTEMIGQSKVHKRLVKEIKLVGGSDLIVLVNGETGVGKELVVRAVHAASPRANKPLISLNCAALPETLVESELFGHVRGAFTGALNERSGKFEQANGGTLFLDEVGELSLAAQAKLLRVLQSGQLQRLGSDKEHQVDVRLIAATNRDLAEEVRNGRYRADFYHRLSVYPLQVPALRERGRDVLLLAEYFLEQNRSRMGLGSLHLASDAQAALLTYNWPGNVRELEHLIGRSALKAMGNCRERPKILSMSAQDLDLPDISKPAIEAPLQAPLQATQAVTVDLRQATEHYQRQIISACLVRHQYNWASAARELGVDRANLGRMAKRLGFK